MDRHWHAIVMAGGAGTRFWPASRKLCPKQFLALGSRPDESLLRATVRRVSQAVPAERVIVATGEHLVQATSAQLPEIPTDNILAEPVPRNTAPCIAWATAHIAARDPQAIIAVLPADHAIADEPAFSAVLEQAMQVAATGVLTTIGVVPTRPETGYGYIERGTARPDGAFEVLRFVEKPDRERAESMVQSGRFLWNAGYFFFRADVMLKAIETYLPAVADGVRTIVAAGDKDTLRQEFPRLPSISIDYGVMEKASPIAVVPGSFGWSDVGSWEAAWELASRDARGNAAPSQSILIDCEDNFVAAWPRDGGSGKIVALLGVRDLVVVDTDDALLVMPRSRSQDVRAIVSALESQKRTDKL